MKIKDTIVGRMAGYKFYIPKDMLIDWEKEARERPFRMCFNEEIRKKINNIFKSTRKR